MGSILFYAAFAFEEEFSTSSWPQSFVFYVRDLIEQSSVVDILI